VKNKLLFVLCAIFFCTIHAIAQNKKQVKTCEQLQNLTVQNGNSKEFLQYMFDCANLDTNDLQYLQSPTINRVAEEISVVKDDNTSFQDVAKLVMALKADSQTKQIIIAQYEISNSIDNLVNPNTWQSDLQVFTAAMLFDSITIAELGQFIQDPKNKKETYGTALEKVEKIIADKKTNEMKRIAALQQNEFKKYFVRIAQNANIPAIAAKYNKPVLVFTRAASSPSCAMFEGYMLGDSAVVAFLKNNYTCCYIEFEIDNTTYGIGKHALMLKKKLLKQFNPLLELYNKKGKVESSLSMDDPKYFLAILKEEAW
jgi:hypothetical protein